LVLAAFKALESCCCTTAKEQLEAARLYVHCSHDLSRGRAMLGSARAGGGNVGVELGCEGPDGLDKGDLPELIEIELESRNLP